MNDMKELWSFSFLWCSIVLILQVRTSHGVFCDVWWWGGGGVLGTTAHAWGNHWLWLVVELDRCWDGQISEASLACVPVGEEECGIESWSWCAHMYEVQFDISASYCAQRCAAAGGIFSCFIHELINSSQNALLSDLTNTQPACVCLLRHSSLLAEGHRKQHKLSVQLHAPQ